MLTLLLFKINFNKTLFFRYHAVSHYSGEKKDALKPFTCEVCGLKVIDSYKLKLHQQCHTNVKLFKCDFCPSEFSKRMSLRRHLLKHGVKAEFTCHSCHRGFVVHHEYVHHFNNCNNKIILKSVNT